MANVLGTLFQDIADAIRSKTGGSGTMKPAQFPKEISSIMTGGGQEWVSVAGSISKPDIEANGVQTVAHNLGVVPDIIVVSANFIQPGVASHTPGNLYFAMVMSKKMLGENAAKYSQSFIYNSTTGNGMNIGGSAIEGALDNGLNAIYDVTSTTFTCGNTDYPLLGVAWNWAAYAMK